MPVTPAQTPRPPATVTIQPRFTPGEVLRWQIQIHSAITRDMNGQISSASMDNQTSAQMRIVSSDATGTVAELTITQYRTRVSGMDALATSLRASEDQTAAAATLMPPVRVKIVAGGANQTLSAPVGDQFAEPVTMLEQLARTDSLPSGATHVGDHWTRQRVQDLPSLHFSLPTTLQCSLTGLQWAANRWLATIAVRSNASSVLPPSAIPGFSDFAAQGYASKATLDVTGDSSGRYDVAQGTLQGATSQTHNLLRIELVGPQPQPLHISTRIDSTGSVQRVPVAPAKP